MVLMFDGDETGLLHYFAAHQVTVFVFAGVILLALLLISLVVLDWHSRRVAKDRREPHRGQ